MQEIQHLCMANNSNLLANMSFEKLPGHFSGEKRCAVFTALYREDPDLKHTLFALPMLAFRN